MPENEKARQILNLPRCPGLLLQFTFLQGSAASAAASFGGILPAVHG